MIDKEKIIRLIRYKVNDNDETKYSSYDVNNALNEALRYINLSQTVINSDVLEKIRIYDEKDYGKPGLFALHGVNLPVDYVTLVGITRLDGRKLRPTEITNIPKPTEYKITGDKVYCGSPVFAMAYKKRLNEITDDEDTIDLPEFMTDLIVKTTVMVLEQAENDILLKAIDDTTRAIIPRRRYIGAETKMPFFC